MPGEPRAPFAAGVSANPGGRPKSTPEMIEARNLARASSPDMVRALLAIVTNPEADDHAKIKAANAVLDRALGKPMQAVEVSGPEGAPITAGFDLSRLSDAEFAAFAVTLRRIQAPGDGTGDALVALGSGGEGGGTEGGGSEAMAPDRPR